MNYVEKFKLKYSLTNAQLAQYLGMSQVGVWKWTKEKKNSKKVEMLLQGLELRLTPVVYETIIYEMEKDK